MFKSIIITAILGMLTFIPVQTYGQTQKEVAKERKQINKLSQSELNRKASKTARKETKKYVKEGWKIKPSALPIEKQLDRSYLMQYEYDENNSPKYIMGVASSIGEVYDAAKTQATQIAMEDIAGKISTQVTASIENLIANEQLGAEAVSVVRTISGSKNLIAENLMQIDPIVEMYRMTENKNIEVLIRIAYSSEKAMNAVKKVVRQDLKDRGDKLLEKLEKQLGWDK